MEERLNIVDTAIQAGKFSTLATALTAAGLIETLKGDGPFTVFAPTDEAFAEVPKATLRELLQPENKDKLAAILAYHVLPGKIMARHLVNVNSATTLQGLPLKIDANDGVKVDGAQVITADIDATNGVIHEINRVLMPAKAAATA